MGAMGCITSSPTGRSEAIFTAGTARGPARPYALQWHPWGVVELRKPMVELAFHQDPREVGELLGVVRVRLEPVDASRLTEAQRNPTVARRRIATSEPSKPGLELTVPIDDPARRAEARQLADKDPRSTVPQTPVNRATYLAWCERSGHIERDLRNRKHGPYGPRHLLPSLAKYVASGERRYGESVRDMLRDFRLLD